METVLFMEMTVNGLIAKEDDSTPWSSESSEAYLEFVQRYGNFIIGGKTYDLLSKSEMFREKLGRPLVVAVTKGNKAKSDPNDVIVTSPKAALDAVEKAGFEEALVAGGGELNASFLKEGLLDEVVMDVDSVVWGRGKKLFADVDTDAWLELLDVEKVSNNVVRLRYKVLK